MDLSEFGWEDVIIEVVSLLWRSHEPMTMVVVIMD